MVVCILGIRETNLIPEFILVVRYMLIKTLHFQSSISVKKV